jgi:serine/threonine-protein kinase
MAEVFLALAFGASGFEKRVAIKVLLPEFQGDGTYERMLIEEARLGSRLSHANLVGVHDLGVDDGAYYVRLDFIDGADLAALLGRGPLPAPLALLAAEGAAQALAHLHACTDESGRPLGLVHRDVSPSNLLLSRTGEVKLADLGIAKATLLADASRSRARKGKFAYMSPEMVAGLVPDRRSDLFSLGSLIFEALTGRPAFAGTSPVDTMERIARAERPAMALLDPALRPMLEPCLERCLARRPEERYPDASALARELALLRRALPPCTEADLGAWVSARLAEGEPR